jgi:hypothetical protein
MREAAAVPPRVFPPMRAVDAVHGAQKSFYLAQSAQRKQCEIERCERKST